MGHIFKEKRFFDDTDTEKQKQEEVLDSTFFIPNDPQ